MRTAGERSGSHLNRLKWLHFKSALTMHFAIGSRHPSCGRSSVLIRSLSRNAARFALRGVASVSITTSLRLRESQEVRKQEERHGAQHAPHGMQSAPAGE